MWAATARQVLRILTDGTVEDATPAEQFARLTDLAVASDGTTAYVLERPRPLGRLPRDKCRRRRARRRHPRAQRHTAHGLLAATSASTESVRSITTDGSTIAMSSPEYQRVVRFPIGGTITQVLDGYAAESVTMLGADLAVGINATPAHHWRLDRVSAAGTVRGRLLGLDPAAPWSPDGVRADDAEVGEVRGSAALPSGLTVFTTRAGLVREVALDGRLHTRASLAPLATRKGRHRHGRHGLRRHGCRHARPRVPASWSGDHGARRGGRHGCRGATRRHARRRRRQWRARGRGASGRVDPGVLATGLSADRPRARRGCRARRRGRRASGHVRRSGRHGAHRGRSLGRCGGERGRVDHARHLIRRGARLLVSSGAMLPVRADFAPASQVQAVDGDALIAGGGTVRLVTDPGLPAPAEPLAVTATPGGGRITLHSDESLVQQVTIMAKRGTTPPADRWDGVVVRQEQPVLTIGDEPLRAGEVWSFAIFPWVQVSAGEALSVMVQGAPTTVTAAALTDTTPPPRPRRPRGARDPHQGRRLLPQPARRRLLALRRADAARHRRADDP